MVLEAKESICIIRTSAGGEEINKDILDFSTENFWFLCRGKNFLNLRFHLQLGEKAEFKKES